MILGIYGAGGAGREVKEIAEANNNWDELIFIDDTQKSGTFKNIKRMSFTEFQQKYDAHKAKVIIALGEPEYKMMLYKKVTEAGYALGNVIHSKALISPSAILGQGLIIKAGAIVSADAVVEDNVSIEEYAVVGHDSVVHKHAQISAFVMIAGGCEIGENTYIGLNVPVKENTKIGSGSIIGMGSVVVRNIPDGVIAMGNPARAMKKVDGQKVFR